RAVVVEVHALHGCQVGIVYLQADGGVAVGGAVDQGVVGAGIEDETAGVVVCEAVEELVQAAVEQVETGGIVGRDIPCQVVAAALVEEEAVAGVGVPQGIDYRAV